MLKKYKTKNLQKISRKFSNNSNWYCLYDNKSEKYASMEIRIKLSECCYKTLPYMNVRDLIKNEIKNSVLVYDAGFENHKLNFIIKQLIKNKNYIILIGPENKIKKIKKNINYLYKISYTSKFEDFSTIFSVIRIPAVSIKVIGIPSKIISLSKYFIVQ